jgi:simple sugar transport system permease protein
VTSAATTQDAAPVPSAREGPARRWPRALALTLIPIALALVFTGIILALLDRDAIAFYRDIVQAGAGRASGLTDTILRTVPILIVGCGVIVVFRAGLWNLGIDGQFLLAGAFVAGLGPWVMSIAPVPLGWVILSVIAMAVGGAWTLIPSWLKARHGINEIVTTLMMSFIGISIAQILVIGPFDGAQAVPQTESIPQSALLPDLPGSRIHVGVILALVICVVVHLVFSRTSFGTRLDVLGANPRAALHVGIDVPRLIVVAFLISGALIGLAAATDIQGELAYMRADWNPAYGLAVVPLVFLARLNALALIPVALFFTMLSVGGLYAAREARLPTDFVLLFMGILLLFMVGTQYLGDKLARGEKVLRWGGHEGG